jgi:hypothetical protein
MAIPHIILYPDVGLTGANHLHVFTQIHWLAGWNDMVTSFVILEGNWEFFFDVDFNNQMGGAGTKLGPGVYTWIEAALGPGTNDRMTSLRPA